MKMVHVYCIVYPNWDPACRAMKTDSVQTVHTVIWDDMNSWRREIVKRNWPLGPYAMTIRIASRNFVAGGSNARN